MVGLPLESSGNGYWIIRCWRNGKCNVRIRPLKKLGQGWVGGYEWFWCLGGGKGNPMKKEVALFK